MSEKSCIDTTSYLAGIAGGLTTVGMTVASEGTAIVQGVVAGQGVTSIVNTLGNHICHEAYHPSSILSAVEYDPDTHIATYISMDQNSSDVHFDYLDMTCQPLDEGLCVPADTAESHAVDNGGLEDSMD